jgi:hypothetical protein
MFENIRSKETTKLQWLQDPSQINGHNFNSIRCEASRHFRNKMREYLKHKINEVASRTRISETCREE